jgi:hypothetical protein
VYERGVKVSVNDYRKKTARQKYAKSAEYAKFQELQFVRTGLYLPALQNFRLTPRAQEIRHPDTAMPPITSLLPKGLRTLLFVDWVTMLTRTRAGRCQRRGRRCRNWRSHSRLQMPSNNGDHHQPTHLVRISSSLSPAPRPTLRTEPSAGTSSQKPSWNTSGPTRRGQGHVRPVAATSLSAPMT